MTLNYRQIVEDTRSLTRMFKALESFQQALEQLASLEEAVTSAERAKAIAVDERERAVQAANQAKGQLSAALAEVTEAKAKGKQAFEDAAKRADLVLADANVKARGLLAAAELDLKAIQAQKADLEVQAGLVEDAIETRKNELAEVEGKIAKLKAQAARLLGGD